MRYVYVLCRIVALSPSRFITEYLSVFNEMSSVGSFLMGLGEVGEFPVDEVADDVWLISGRDRYYLQRVVCL